jgi:PmbA protein
MRDILAQAKKVADDAEVFQISSHRTSLQFESNRLKNIETKQTSQVTLRLIRNGRIGIASSTEPNNQQSLVNEAKELAVFGNEAGFNFPSVDKFPHIIIDDSSIESVTLEEMNKLGEALISLVRQHSPDIICQARVLRDAISIHIVNSCGGQANYSKTLFNLGIEGTLIRDTDMLFVGETQSSCRPLTESRIITDVVINQLELSRNQASIKNGILPVIFTPNGVASALLPSIMTALNGRVVFNGASPLGSRLGELVFDRKFSMLDDPLINYRPGSRPCDDEGVSSQRTPLISDGVIGNFLYDLQTAALAEAKSTGNGNRNRGGLPSPSPSTLVITPGSIDFHEMVSDVKEGLLVEWLMGATQGNVLGGDFSGNVLLGYKIANGQVVGRLKDTMISGNVYQLLSDITAISRDVGWVGGYLSAPYIYCPRLSVTSK